MDNFQQITTSQGCVGCAMEQKGSLPLCMISVSAEEESAEEGQASVLGLLVREQGPGSLEQAVPCISCSFWAFCWKFPSEFLVASNRNVIVHLR